MAVNLYDYANQLEQALEIVMNIKLLKMLFLKLKIMKNQKII